MEQALEQEIEGARKRVRQGYGDAVGTLDGLIELIRTCKRRAVDEKASNRAKLDAVMKMAKGFEAADALTKLKNSNKAIHGSLAKLGKTLDRLLTPEEVDIFRKACKQDEVLEEEMTQSLNEAIMLQLLAQGDFDVAKQIAEEIGSTIDEDSLQVYKELFAVWESLRGQDPLDVNLDIILTWAAQHKPELDKIGSELLFEILRMRFLQLVARGDTTGAVEYARQNFAAFKDGTPRQREAVQTLMGSLVFVDPNAVKEQAKVLKECFAVDGCFIRNLPRIDSPPMSTALQAGQTSLQILKKYFKIFANAPETMDTTKKTRTTPADEENETNTPSNAWVDGAQFVVPVPLDEQEFTFHSMFICPVSKECTTEANYPVLLRCGHVIANDSMQRIAKAGGRFKCPTCQSDQNTYRSQRIFF